MEEGLRLRAEGATETEEGRPGHRAAKELAARVREEVVVEKGRGTDHMCLC